MVRLASLLQLALVALSLGAVVPRQVQEYDAIIVGGGPSGLSALSGLARVRRNVLMIDSGEYRNGKTRHLHDLIGFDGVTPAYYRYAARELLAHYDTAHWTNGTVTRITPLDSTSFTVSSTAFNGTEQTYRARRIVLATGLRDLVPATPGLRESWARGVFWCPWCDGYEHRDQRLGLLVPLDEVASTLQEVLTLNADVVAFVNGTDTPAGRAAAEARFPRWADFLALKGVTVDNRVVTDIVRLADGGEAYDDETADPGLPTRPEFDRFRLDFVEGGSVERDAFLVSFPKEQASNVGAQMGVALYGGRLYANSSNSLLTNVPGVYAVGDANTDNSTNLPHALWSGKRAAVSLHVNLEREDTQALLAGNVKRAEELDPRSIWETMNDKPGDVFYAGEFDQ